MPLGARSPGSHWRARVGFVVGAIAIALAALAPAAGAAASPPWTEAPYSYYAENVPLTTALRDFASSFSLALELTPSINGKVNGQFNAKSPTEFIDRLAGVYSLNWFVHAGTLYVSRTKEAVTRRISSGAAASRRCARRWRAWACSIRALAGASCPARGWRWCPARRLMSI